jgi:hypothetical protein
MARTLTTQDVSWFLDLNEKGQLDLNPPYQRRSVWSPRDKRFFVDTILNNYPAPPVFLHKTLDENGKPTYHVVDGKQRLQTIIEFTKNAVRIPDDFAEVNLQKKRWDDLERGTRERFWNYVLIAEMLPDVTDASVRNTFERINRNSRKLMQQELRHAKYEGWFITNAEAESEKKEWKDLGVVTTSRSKRMGDVQFISELMDVTIKARIAGFDQDALDEIYAAFEDLIDQPEFVEDDFRRNFDGTKEYIQTMLATDKSLLAHLKVQTHFYSLWAYLTLEAERRLDPESFAPLYKMFLTEVAAELNGTSETPSRALEAIRRAQIVKYAANTRGASTDFTPRKARHDALVAIMHPAEASADESQ